MGQFEPPSSISGSKSSSVSSVFFIGQDSHGNWVAQDQQHLHGGLFVDREDALRFALFENGNRLQSVVMVPGVLELDMSNPVSSPLAAMQAEALREPRIA